MQRKSAALHQFGAGHPHAPKPARKVITRAPWRPVHRFCSVKTKRRIECESFLERDFAYLLDADPEVLDFASQPETFNYEVDGVMRTYTPDFLVLYEGHSEIVEVKPSTRLDQGPPWDIVAAVIGGCGYGLAGTPETVAVIEASKELNRRCFDIVPLDPLDWNKPFDFKMFHTFLAKYETQLPFEKPSNLTAPATALRFYNYSKGVIGVVAQLIIKATIIALHRGKERLDDEVLLKASDSLLVPAERPMNPFRCADLPPPQSLPVELGTGRQTRLRASRKPPNPADVIDGKVDVSKVLAPTA